MSFNKYARNNNKREFKPRGAPKPRPNYFFATRIEEKEIIEVAKTTQETILRGDARLRNVMTPANKLHLTLGVLKIPDSEVLGEVLKSFSECNGLVDEQLGSSCKLNLKGVGTFGNRVIWMGIEENEDLAKMRKTVVGMREHLLNTIKGLYVEERDFNPHITLFKLRNGGSFNKLSKEVEDVGFGVHTVQTIELLSMQEKDDDGYYKCYARLRLGVGYEEVHREIPSRYVEKKDENK